MDKTDDKYPTYPSPFLMSTYSASLKNSPGTFLISQDHCSWQPLTAQTNTNSNVQTIIPFNCISQLHVNPSATAGTKNLLKITPIHSIAAESVPVSDQVKQLDPSGYLFNFEEKSDRDQVLSILTDRVREAKLSVPAPKSMPTLATGTSQPAQSVPKRNAVALSPEMLKCRAQVLAQNVALFNMHQSIVVESGMMDEEEFWAAHQPLLATWRIQHEQERGIAGIVLDDIKSPTASHNSQTLLLTPHLIQSIFIQYPAVRAAYLKLVPTSMRERDFWTQFFTSRYFTQKSKGDESSLFDECFCNDFVVKDNEERDSDSNISSIINTDSGKGKNQLMNKFNIQSGNILQSLQKITSTTENISTAFQQVNERQYEDNLPILISVQQPLIDATLEDTKPIQISSTAHQPMNMSSFEHLIQCYLEPSNRKPIATSYKNDGVDDTDQLIIEYLRHFWNTYSPKMSEGKRDRLKRIVEGMRRLKKEKQMNGDMEGTAAIDRCISLFQ